MSGNSKRRERQSFDYGVDTALEVLRKYKNQHPNLAVRMAMAEVQVLIRAERKLGERKEFCPEDQGS